MEQKVLFNYSDPGPEKYGATEEITVNKNNVTRCISVHKILAHLELFSEVE